MMSHTIAQNLQRLKDSKTAIKNAIISKGGSVSSNDGFEDFANDISNIPMDYNTKIYAFYPSSFRLINSMEDVIVPSGVTGLGYGAFQNYTTLKRVTMPDSVTTFANFVFSGCSSLEYVRLSINLETLPTGAFENCTSLASIEIPYSVYWIYRAFTNCTALTAINISSHVSYIETTCFNGCTNLLTITINKPTDSISGAPWGATNATVIWTG